MSMTCLGGGIVTELVQDEQEGLRHEARERDSAWVKGDVGPEERSHSLWTPSRGRLVYGSGYDRQILLSQKVRGHVGR